MVAIKYVKREREGKKREKNGEEKDEKKRRKMRTEKRKIAPRGNNFTLVHISYSLYMHILEMGLEENCARKYYYKICSWVIILNEFVNYQVLSYNMCMSL